MPHLLAIDIVALRLKFQQRALLVLAVAEGNGVVDAGAGDECEDGGVEEVGVAEAAGREEICGEEGKGGDVAEVGGEEAGFGGEVGVC